jgi:deoxyhypusine synthase
MKIEPIDLNRVKTSSIKTRKNKVYIRDFARVYERGWNVKQFMDSLPRILKAEELRASANAVVTAKKNNKQVILAMGDSVVKVGLSPLVIELMKKGIITAIAMQGAGVIHDTEIALIGETSEDVAVTIKDGSFGMAEETGSILNDAIKSGVTKNLGLGEAAGKIIDEIAPPFKDLSITYNAYKLGVPLTVHVAYGTDIIHMHPKADGAAIGKATEIDFRKFTTIVTMLEGGVIINIGSAVILPEVFLKALSVARNIGYDVKNFTAINMDMIQHYRPLKNVVERPTKTGGQGFAITGHHEIMFPLLTAFIIELLGA